MVEQFVNECLGGDWSRLEDVNPKGDYDPHDPLAGSWWLKCPGRTFDCDDCELSRAVYRDVWGLGAPDYRGDTMNSFRTLLGHERFTTHVTDVSRAFDGTEAPRWFDLPEEVKNRVRDYYWTYHTIGNFLPLPDAEVDGTTLNRWRGTCAWHDYFCPFLAGVKRWLEGRDVAQLPVKFVRLMEANEYFWGRYRGRFGDYVREYFLDGYLDEDGEVIEMPIVRARDVGLTAASYAEAVTRYLDFAEDVIADRAERIILRLKSR